MANNPYERYETQTHFGNVCDAHSIGNHNMDVHDESNCVPIKVKEPKGPLKYVVRVLRKIYYFFDDIIHSI